MMQNGIYFTRAAKACLANEPSEEISEIIPGKLYLGSIEAAKDKGLLRSRNITHIVNVSGLPCYFEDDFTYKQCKITDGGDKISKYFQPASEFIADGDVVFVHCHGGVSRSSTIVIAHLMIHEDMSLEEATAFVKDKRPIINPHFLFLIQLEHLEENLGLQKHLELDETEDDELYVTEEDSDHLRPTIR